MKEIIGDNHEVFKTRSRKPDVVQARQMIYYYAFEKYLSATRIQDYLMDTYGFSVNQSTIYYSWRKVASKMAEVTVEDFQAEHSIFDKYELADRYAAYQLSLHLDGYMRGDIKRKIQHLNSKYESLD